MVRSPWTGTGTNYHAVHYRLVLREERVDEFADSAAARDDRNAPGRRLVRFDAELRLNGKTATGIPVPDSVLEGLGGGRRPQVRVTLNGHSFQTSLGTMSGQVLIPVSAVIRSAAGIEAGDRMDVEIELATAPAPVVVPDDLQLALDDEPDAREFFAGLTASQKRGYTEWVEQAKKAETRQRRLEQTVDALRQHRSRR